MSGEYGPRFMALLCAKATALAHMLCADIVGNDCLNDTVIDLCHLMSLELIPLCKFLVVEGKNMVILIDLTFPVIHID